MSAKANYPADQRRMTEGIRMSYQHQDAGRGVQSGLLYGAVASPALQSLVAGAMLRRSDARFGVANGESAPPRI